MRSLRTYLDKIDSIIPDQIVRVKEPIDHQYGVTAYVEKMSRQKTNPVLYFEKVKGFSSPVVINIFGHVDRMNLALEGASRPLKNRIDFYNAWNDLIKREVPPIQVKKGPAKDICILGDEVDLTSLPILRFYEQDAGRYITSGLLVARDPDNPAVVNLSYARMQLKGRNRLGTTLHSRGNMWSYLEKSKAKGKALDVAVIIGAHPAIYLAAAAKITGEYYTAGALLGEPIELVKTETNDLPIPAESELVLEGQILLEEEDEGPFTGYTGYLSGRSTRNGIQISCVTMRRNAIYYTIMPSNSDEHLLLSGFPKQARIYNALKSFMPVPALKDIYWPVSGTHYVCFISLEKSVSSIPGFPKQVAMLAMGLDSYIKIVAIFGDDINLSDLSNPLKAIASRCDLKIGSGIEIVGDVFINRLDPSSVKEGVSSKMIIDATGPEIIVGEKAMVKRKIGVPQVKDISYPCSGDLRLCVVKVSNDFENMSSLVRDKVLHQSRIVVSVNKDIDINDCKEVLWALATRFQPDRDVTVLDGKIGIDATTSKTWKAMKATIPTTHA